MGPKVHTRLRVIFSLEFVTICDVTREEGVQDRRWQSVTWGRGFKNIDLLSNVLFEWPLRVPLDLNRIMGGE